MTLKVGVIGTGMIGQDHIRRLTHVVSGAQVVAVADAEQAVAEKVAANLPGARVHTTGAEVVADPDVDAVIVCSWGPTHEEYVVASVDAGKPVFCEKPLATTTDACLRIIEAEGRAGRRLVQVGFMRRYDADYRALKQVVDSGAVGAPLIFHSGHRNPSVPAHYTKDMAIVDTAVHDFDVSRWLLGEELAAIRVIAAKPNSQGVDLQDPLLMIIETTSGVLVNVETSVNIRYGYDIRGEVVGESGTAALAERGPVVLRSAGSVGVAVPQDWRERFIAAYDVELQEWIDEVSAGADPTGPSSWDGYAAQVVCDAGLAALYGGERVEIRLVDKPALYT
ncbi:MAG: Gfo/Idh/MocA family oxidoreductase [Nocardioidaceae bacterium]|nr:Gfo/Idh/MocA family oxidoreductase [Nocardioidaceae bacterium]NUS50343.1 Gfo/Idh/MocA family oxidoreductase [Nocardioidaceae bacterium]